MLRLRRPEQFADFIRLPGNSLSFDRIDFPAGIVPEQKGDQKVDIQYQGCVQGSHGGLSLQVRNQRRPQTDKPKFQPGCLKGETFFLRTSTIAMHDDIVG